jgi:hypothetical protein
MPVSATNQSIERKHAGKAFGHDFPLSQWERDSRESWNYIRWRRRWVESTG